jgi:uncharacterized membrane protein YvbJ
MKVCSKCGFENKDRIEYCGKCGENLDTIEALI